MKGNPFIQLSPSLNWWDIGLISEEDPKGQAERREKFGWGRDGQIRNAWIRPVWEHGGRDPRLSGRAREWGGEGCPYVPLPVHHLLSLQPSKKCRNHQAPRKPWLFSSADHHWLLVIDLEFLLLSLWAWSKWQKLRPHSACSQSQGGAQAGHCGGMDSWCSSEAWPEFWQVSD